MECGRQRTWATWAGRRMAQTSWKLRLAGMLADCCSDSHQVGSSFTGWACSPLPIGSRAAGSMREQPGARSHGSAVSHLPASYQPATSQLPASYQQAAADSDSWHARVDGAQCTGCTQLCAQRQLALLQNGGCCRRHRPGVHAAPCLLPPQAGFGRTGHGRPMRITDISARQPHR